MFLTKEGESLTKILAINLNHVVGFLTFPVFCKAFELHSLLWKLSFKHFMIVSESLGALLLLRFMIESCSFSHTELFTKPAVNGLIQLPLTV